MKFNILIFSVIVLLSVNVSEAQITDGSMNTYTTMEIGDQTWLKEDLKATRVILREEGGIKYDPESYCNMNNITDAETWEMAGERGIGVYCQYDNDSTDEGGLLYNWYAVQCNICPSGFRIPTDEELKELTAFEAKAKKDVGDGIRQPDGKFVNGGSTQKTYWSSTSVDAKTAKNGCAYTSHGISWSDPVDKSFGLYVRCIKIK